MKRVALVAVAVVAFASTLTATAISESKKKSTPHVPPPITCTAQGMVPFAKKVWRLDLWDRGQPKAKATRALKKRLKCAPSASHRKAMKKRWRRAKGRYYDHRAKKLREQEYQSAIDPPGIAVLEAIAACESGGNPAAVSPNGTYRGKYQFSFSTWASVGGSGDPAAASEREQDVRAAILYNQAGAAPWPVCGV